MINKKGCVLGAVILTLLGCEATGERHRANVYSAGQVNVRQEAKTVQILAVMPAKIEVDNSKGRQRAQAVGGFMGALLGAAAGERVNSSRYDTHQTVVAGAAAGALTGAAAGSLVNETTLVEGVSLTYLDDGRTLNSAQVGRACEFQPGIAVLIASESDETRIQPNTVCDDR